MRIETKVIFKAGESILQIFFKTPFEKLHNIIIRDANTKHELFTTSIEKFDQKTIDDNIHFYYTFYSHIKNIHVEIISENQIKLDKIISLEEYRWNVPMVMLERPIGYAGMGDNFFALPVIKKLNEIFNKKVDVITRYPQLFINNPHIGNVHKIEPTESAHDLYEKYQLKSQQCFFDLMPGHEDRNLSLRIKHRTNYFVLDPRQSMALDCGFQLLNKEMEMNFYPDPYQPINLPENYVLINPYVSGIDRDIGKENWQKIIDALNEQNINVVTIGLPGKYHDVTVHKGINLCGQDCQNNLSQTWHIINRAKCFLTFDTGIYVLAGTTNTHIFLIDTYLNPEWHKPYRNHLRNDGLTVIKGECQEYCLSNLKYYFIENGEFEQCGVQKCALNHSSFKCIPSTKTICNSIINWILLQTQ